MPRRMEIDKKDRPNSVAVCMVAGVGFGSSLGLLFGISFDNMAYLVFGAICGAMMGMAIGESNRKYKELRSS